MIVISFSGLDGCGKSTQVELTARYLTERGLRVRSIVTFHASAAYLATRLREWLRRRRITAQPEVTRSSTGHRVRPIAGQRTFDQDRQATGNRLRRGLVYPIDHLVLRGWLTALWARGYDAVVCDRYTFDKLVNLPNPNGLLGRLVRWIAPRPDAAFFLDADWDAIRTRRVEHPEDYYRTKYAGYRRLVEARTGLIPIVADHVATAHSEITARLAHTVEPIARRRALSTASNRREIEPHCP